MAKTENPALGIDWEADPDIAGAALAELLPQTERAAEILRAAAEALKDRLHPPPQTDTERAAAFEDSLRLLELGPFGAILHEAGIPTEPLRRSTRGLRNASGFSFRSSNRAHRRERSGPAGEIIEQHARRLIEQQLTAEALDKVRAELAGKAAAHKLPRDMVGKVRQLLAARPALPWDLALAQVLGGG